MKTTWRKEIAEEMEKWGESFNEHFDVVLGETVISAWESVTGEEQILPGSLDREFDAGYGCTNGCPFTLWTANRVYFPVQYDGAEWVGSVPRNPGEVATTHMGGG